MEASRAGKSRSSKDTHFKKTDEQHLQQAAWTESLDVVFNLNSEESKKRTVVKITQSENDVINSFLGLIKGYKKKITELEQEVEDLKKGDEECQSQSQLDQLSLPLMPAQNVPQ